MAESRRMEFTTITQGGKKKQKEIPLTTHRFCLTLTSTTETTCPEFSFTELMKNALKKQIEEGQIKPDDPFDNQDVAEQKKLEAIAKAFEEKYAPRLKSKGGCDRLSDLVDIGDGYDETDNFIDNSEAYDELIPACMTTKLGGFYINSGHLDFKYISDDSSEEFQVNNSIKKRKVNRIDSDSESEEEQPKKGPQKKKFKDDVDIEHKKKKKLGPDGERIKVKRGRKPTDDKLKKKKNSPTVAELLKQQTASTSTTSHIVNGSGDDVENDVKPLEKSSIESTIEAVLSEVVGDDSGSRDGTDKKSSAPEAITPLPADLPASLVDIIEQIKQAARESREGKCKFFSESVNKMLLDIEIGSRQMAFGHRTTIYTHLSSYLPCSKETLIKRAKNLRLGQQDNQLRKPLRKLKEAVDNVMPLLQERYEAEQQKALQMRIENKEKGDGDSGVKDYASTESDEEEKTNQDSANKKRIMGPRKKFQWTENITNCLCDVVRVKMQMFSVSKVRAQTAEEYLRAFLDAEVKPIWPQGWMQTRMLFKQSRSVHASWTNPNKAKKTLLTSKAASPNRLATPTSIPLKRETVSKESPNNNSYTKKVKDAIEIVSSSGEEEKTAPPDADSECMKLEDYITMEDVDHLFSSIGTAEPHIPTLLDYTDKSASSPTIVSATSTINTLSTTVKTLPPATSHTKHSTNTTIENKNSRITEAAGRNLVADMLQKPLPTKTKSVSSSVQKTPTHDGGNRDSPFLAEFQKHLNLSSTTGNLHSETHSSSSSSSNQGVDLMSTSRLQSMLTSPLVHQSSKGQTSGSKQYEQFLKQKSYIPSEQRPAKSPSTSSQQAKPVSPMAGTQVNVIDSRAKVETSHSKRDHGNSSSNSIDKEAIKQLHYRLMQMAGSGKMAGLVKDSSRLSSSSGTGSQSLENRKSADVQKSLVDTTAAQQLFKQPLPASSAAQLRVSPQLSKSGQGSTQKCLASSSVKNDTQTFQSGGIHRQPAQAHQRVHQNISQNQQSASITSRQPSISQGSRNSFSSPNNRPSSTSYVSITTPTSSRHTSVPQAHGSNLVSPTGSRQTGVSHGSPSKLTSSSPSSSSSDSRNSANRISPSSRIAVSPRTSPTSSNTSMLSQIRDQSNSQAFLSKIIESELKAATAHKVSQMKMSQPVRNVSHSKPQVLWQSSQAGRVPPFTTTSSTVSNSFIGQNPPGYQSLKLSLSKDSSAAAGAYSVVSPSLRLQNPSPVSGSRSNSSQPVNSKSARQGPFGTQPGHSPASQVQGQTTQVTQMQGQTTQVTQLQNQSAQATQLQRPPSPQIPGLPPLYSSSHSILSPTSPLYRLPPYTDSSHGY